ncbi:NfeD family protein [Planctomycetaceae bacterium SH139]
MTSKFLLPSNHPGNALRAACVLSFCLLAVGMLAVGWTSDGMGQAPNPEASNVEQPEQPIGERAAGEQAAGEQAAGERAAGERGEEGRLTYVIPLDGEINPSLQGFFQRNFETALAAGAEVIVLDIDSPGGRLDTTLEMTEVITAAEQVETVAFIRNSAYSGAAMLALACDRIEMHPEAQMGDVGVIVGGLFSPFQYVEEKQRSPVVASIRTLAENRDRPAALAEAMVDKDVTVFSATHKEDGRQAYFTEAGWESLADQEDWLQGPPVFETRERNFLTVNGRRAVELGLAEGTSRSLDEVLGQIGAERPAKVLAWTWVDTLIDWLNSFWITALLILIGLLALVLELSAPGISIGGLVSLLCFSLFFWSRFLGGTAGWLEVTLFLMALAFIAAEFFLIPGFGVAGISGAFLLILSLVMASQRVLLPQSGGGWSDLGWNLLAVCGALTAFVIGVFLLADQLGNLPLFRRLVLEPPALGGAGGNTFAASNKPVQLSPWERLGIGDLGRTVSPLRPSGKAQFADEIVDVATEGEFIDTDTAVRVYRKQRGKVIVRPA